MSAGSGYWCSGKGFSVNGTTDFQGVGLTFGHVAVLVDDQAGCGRISPASHAGAALPQFQSGSDGFAEGGNADGVVCGSSIKA